MRIVETLSCVLAIGGGLLAVTPALAFDGSRSGGDVMAAPVAVAPLAAPETQGLGRPGLGRPGLGRPGLDGPGMGDQALAPNLGEPTMTAPGVPPGLVPPGLIPQAVTAPALAAPVTAMEAFRSGAHWLKLGEKHKAVVSLEYAAENGHALAQWKLGRMYQEGDGVAQNDLKAFEYFSRIANSHADDNPDTPQARFVANAFVALGRYYLSGIPNSKIKADAERAREMFSYAASYFGNADAQYDLARLYLDGVGAPRDPRYGTRWLGLAAQKGQHEAQALLGQMLFNGDHLPRQAARGLMWLTLARDAAGPDEGWIKDSYNKAIAKASEDDRAMALQMLEHWVQGRRD